MSATGGHRHWYVPDGFIPPLSPEDGPTSHEALCVLNVGDEDAEIAVTFYFEDRPPSKVSFQVPAARTRHARTDQLNDMGAAIPEGVPYAYRVVSSVPVVVQHSRLDATPPHYTLFTTMAHPE